MTTLPASTHDAPTSYSTFHQRACQRGVQMGLGSHHSSQLTIRSASMTGRRYGARNGLSQSSTLCYRLTISSLVDIATAHTTSPATHDASIPRASRYWGVRLIGALWEAKVVSSSRLGPACESSTVTWCRAGTPTATDVPVVPLLDKAVPETVVDAAARDPPSG